MNHQHIEPYLSGMPAAAATLPFGPEVVVYKVLGKMFAMVYQRDSITYLTLKAAPGDVSFLVDEFRTITRGYHMNKKHWITIGLSGEVDDGMLQDLITRSWQLVVAKLKKTDRERLNPQL